MAVPLKNIAHHLGLQQNILQCDSEAHYLLYSYSITTLQYIISTPINIVTYRLYN